MRRPAVLVHFLIEVKSFLKAALAAADAGSQGDPADWQIAVKVVSYRMRSGFTRFMFGMLAGKDGVDSQVQVLDASGKVLGDSNVSTFNVTAVGSGEDVAKMHADEIAKFVLGDKRVSKPARTAGDARAAEPGSDRARRISATQSGGTNATRKPMPATRAVARVMA